MPLSRYFPTFIARTQSLSLSARIAGASGIVTSMLALRLLLAAWLPLGVPFLFFFGAVLLSTSMFGRAGGLFATGLSCAYTSYFLMPPVGNFQIHDPRHLVGLGLFITISSLLTLTISWLHEAVADLKSSERHRTVLLREFRHRTKNDIAGIAARLRLLARVAPTPECRDLMAKGASNALAVARIHNHLSRAIPGGASGAVICTDEFLGGLCADLRGALLTEHPISLDVAVERHSLSTERAVSLGTVVTEIFTNTADHAFPFGRMGKVIVQFQKQGGEFWLVITDNGSRSEPIGPIELHVAAMSARVLVGVSKQLRGSFMRVPATDGPGMRFELRFPVTAPAPLHMSPH